MCNAVVNSRLRLTEMQFHSPFWVRIDWPDVLVPATDKGLAMTDILVVFFLKLLLERTLHTATMETTNQNDQ